MLALQHRNCGIVSRTVYWTRLRLMPLGSCEFAVMASWTLAILGALCAPSRVCHPLGCERPPTPSVYHVNPESQWPGGSNWWWGGVMLPLSDDGTHVFWRACVPVGQVPERSEEPDIVLRLDMVICLADRPAQPLSGAATVRLRTLSRQATPTPPPADRRKARAAYRVATCSLGATCSLLIQSPVLRRPCDRAKRLDLLYAKVKGAQPIGPFCGRHQGQPSAGAYAKSSVRHWREQAQGA